MTAEHWEERKLQVRGWNSRFMASHLEFKYRFWVIAAIFWTGFSLYAIDHRNSGHVLAQSLAHLRGASTSTPDHRLVFGVAALIATLAATIRTWGTAYLKPEVMLGTQVVTSHLVADGPYRFVRNPLYLGNILLAVAMGLMASRLGFAVIVLGNIVTVYRLILREEAELEADQGDTYRAYCRAVPRLIPAVFPRVNSAGSVPNYAAAFLGELFFWAFAASIIVFAATLDQRVYYWALAGAFVVCALSVIAVRRRIKPATPGD
jgi:protein-S-isoprenylcysteine O-methyltransferase Ste14